ncbi:MAG: VWA domain-containing protein [Ilumatobacteraceae bacterium]
MRPSAMNRHQLVATLTVITLLGACGSDGGATVSTRVTEPVITTGSSTDPSTTEGPVTTAAAGGWVGGEPEWSATEDGSGTAGASPAYESTDKSSGEAAAPATTSASPLPPGESGDIAPDVSPLRAGNVDDNADFAAFLDYLARLESIGVTTRPFDPTGRMVVTVIGEAGRPAAGVEVAVSAGGSLIATIRTTADGTARFLPMLYGPAQATYDFAVGDIVATAAPGDDVALTSAAAPRSAPVALDVLFLLDATGSMGDEIDRLKATIDSVAGRIAGLETQPDVRFAMTLYRDLDDAFVATTYDFTGNIDEFRAALGNVVAEGGGDYPEALDEGLAEALGTPSWRDPANTVQLVFLVADAPPQVGRQVESPYTASIIAAIERGIKIIPIASSESDDQAEAVFRQIAQATGSRFVFLSYGAGGAATGSSTDIESTDYEELALDDLIVRFVSEELAALTGTEPVETTPPTDATTPPTNPDGQ